MIFFMTLFDPHLFRQYFPLLQNVNTPSLQTGKLIYFDNAATSQKPTCVIDAISEFYHCKNANVHRGSHQLSAQATAEFEQARRIVQQHIKAKSVNEIIWTKGTTEAINLVANSWGLTQLNTGDEIVLSYAEHHANIVPWQIVAQKTGAIIKVLPLDETGRVDQHQLGTIISDKTRLVCINHISNVIGKINPLTAIIECAKAVGALTLVDGAQALAHGSINVQQLECDFYVFSTHKAYASMGLGVLYGKEELLTAMPPYQFGGEMIEKVTFKQTTFNQLPFKFEAGTPNVAAVIAFAKALTFIQKYQQGIHVYEKQLTSYLYSQLSAIEQVNFIVSACPDIPLFSFTITGHHNQDIATALDSYGIAVRSGHHCAMPLMEFLAIDGCIRVSLAAYNTIAEIDFFIQCLKNIINIDENSSLNSLLSSPSDSTVNFVCDSDDIKRLFSASKSWDARHREIMLLGKKLPRLAKEKRSDDNLIHGCESLAWLEYDKNSIGQFYFYADSDAKIIRGLIVIVLAAFYGKTATEINEFAIEDYFSQLGLMQHLSPSRGNGIKAIVKRIKIITTSCL
jgi:SufS family cysteine desulfurase